MKSGYMKLNLGACLLLCLSACAPTSPDKDKFDSAWGDCQKQPDSMTKTVPVQDDGTGTPKTPGSKPVPKTLCADLVEKTAITQCEYQVNRSTKRYTWENVGFVGVQLVSAMAGPISALAGASTTTVSLVAGSTGLATAMGSDAGLVQKAIPSQPKFIVKDLTDNGDAFYSEFFVPSDKSPALPNARLYSDKDPALFYARLYNATLANCQADSVKDTTHLDPDDTAATVSAPSTYPKALH